jgi:Arc/MetJ-type ribon-helix-helix transcriptional regulator
MMKNRKHTEATEGGPADQATALRHLRAAIAAGLASGPGRPADGVFGRLQAKYRKQLEGQAAD